MAKNIFEDEFKTYSLIEKNELVLYLKFYMKRKLKKLNDTKQDNRMIMLGLSQLGDFENTLISEFSKRNLKYIRIDNSKNYDYIEDKYPELFI
jgi:hypothetical protein